ncbi:MAG: hypothetical protein GEU73_14155 [Chloroflexi bacterium]|nr:hypothetical protein [Chloroflexota bacterium]
MSQQIVIAVVAAVPPTVAAVLGFLASKRSIRRSIGGNPGVPLREVLAQMETRSNSRLDRIESKLDRVADEHTGIRERLARLEAGQAPRGRER